MAAQGNMHLKKISVEEVGPIAFRNVIGPTLEYTFESFFDAFGDFLELGAPWAPLASLVAPKLPKGSQKYDF